MFYLNVTSNDSAKVGTPTSSDRVSVREIPLLLFCLNDSKHTRQQQLRTIQAWSIAKYKYKIVAVSDVRHNEQRRGQEVE